MDDGAFSPTPLATMSPTEAVVDFQADPGHRSSFRRVDAYLTDPTLNDPRYVFDRAGSASADSDTRSTFGQAGKDAAGFFIHFVGADSEDGTAPGARISVGPTFILADLVVRYSSRQTTNAGADIFDSNLDPARSSLQDPTGGLLGVSSPSGTTLATVRVLNAIAPVPEPSSLLLAPCGVAFLVLIHRRWWSSPRRGLWPGLLPGPIERLEGHRRVLGGENDTALFFSSSFPAP